MSSDCGHHRRSQACALCLVFSLMLNVHPASCASSPSPGPQNGTLSRASTADHHGHPATSRPGGYRHVPVATRLVLPTHEQLNRTRVFLRKIFDKYGDGGTMTFEGFQELLGSLGVGSARLNAVHAQDVTRHAHHPHDHRTADYDDYEYLDQRGPEEEHEHREERVSETRHQHDQGLDPERHDSRRQGERHSHGEQRKAGEQRRDGHRMHEQSGDRHIVGENRADHRQDIGGHDQHDNQSRVAGGSISDEEKVVAEVGRRRVNGKALPSQHTVTPDTHNTSGISTPTVVTSRGSDGVTASPRHRVSERLGEKLTPNGSLVRGDASANFRSRRLASVRPHPVSDVRPIDSSSHHRQRHHRQRRGSHHGHRNHPDAGNGVMTSPRARRDVTDVLPDSEGQTDMPNPPLAADRDQQCLSTSSLLRLHDIEGPITLDHFLVLCPALIQQIDSGACVSPRPVPLGHVYPPEKSEHDGTAHHEHTAAHNHSEPIHSDTSRPYHVSQVSGEVWGYAFLAVLIISMVGLFSVAIVPIMHKVFYNHLLQFLVALAVGTLTGDALLHLIPHAMLSVSADDDKHMKAAHSGHDAHGDGSHSGHGHHLAGVWRGLVVLSGVYFFFLFERGMGIYHIWQRQTAQKNESDVSSSPKLYHTVEEHESEVGAKLSKHAERVTSCEEIVMVVHPGKDVRHLAEDMHEELHRDCEPEERDQLNHSHGAHGHSHGPLPSSVAAVAWMVIMGDGLHNFFDGLAIGAAFASGLPGGISTSVAVFCHELPHEIGDFAVLLRAGMSVKQAIVYNCVSSVLCVLGMIVGVCIGNIASVTQWIFAATAGMFIYIALVDMLPELTAMAPRTGENPLIHFALQNAGMLVGSGIMAIIAVYEDQITLPQFAP